DLYSFDLAGTQRWTLTLPTGSQHHHAYGISFFVEPTSLTAWNLDGSIRWQLAPDLSAVVDQGHGAVIDARGYIILGRNRYKDPATGNPYPLTHGELAAFDSTGAALWTTDLGEGQIPLTSVILGDGDQVFVGTLPEPNGARAGDVRAFDVLTGKELWRTPIPGGSNAHYLYGGVLALSNTATLVVSTHEALYGIFAGRRHMPEAAPWPRFRGDN